MLKHGRSWIANGSPRLKLEATYLGYALGRLKKIQLHRAWLLNPQGSATREQFGLPHGSVLNGALSFDQLIARAAELQARMTEAMRGCTLSDDVDRTFVDDLSLSLITEGSPS